VTAGRGGLERGGRAGDAGPGAGGWGSGRRRVEAAGADRAPPSPHPAPTPAPAPPRDKCGSVPLCPCWETTSDWEEASDPVLVPDRSPDQPPSHLSGASEGRRLETGGSGARGVASALAAGRPPTQGRRHGARPAAPSPTHRAPFVVADELDSEDTFTAADKALWGRAVLRPSAVRPRAVRPPAAPRPVAARPSDRG